jgi:NADH-quinone oxidoreductase subunit E
MANAETMTDDKRLALAGKITDTADRIIAAHRYDPAEMIGMLLDVQQALGYLMPHVVERIAEKTSTPLSRLYGLATFYRGFSLTPRGRHQVNVCLGTACHVRGGRSIFENVLKLLNVRPGGTTRDLRFSVDTVRCLGCCSLSPVMQIDGEVFGRLESAELDGVLERFE